MISYYQQFWIEMKKWKWDIENDEFLNKTIERCRNNNIILPTFKELKHPELIPPKITKQLSSIKTSDLNPLNLFRINWCNDPGTGKFGEINYLEIPREISGIDARIVGLVGKNFPTGAHKVGATYGCLAPYLVTGRFNPDYHKAVWPSTGNYCRGGAFNSALLSVHSVAILPEEMSRERFEWLKELGSEIYATPGCESNVKEIYDKCHELRKESDEYLIFNQFDEFGNAIWHYEITGFTISELFNHIRKKDERISGYVSATGSAGTLAAGDYLKKVYPWIKVLASEALQCPTILMNGFGAHRIEGIGDKHIPWIHNVKNTDLACSIDDNQVLSLLRLFNEPEGHSFLSKNGIQKEILEKLSLVGISGICNLLSAIKMAKYYELGKNDIIFTVFTDSVELYYSRLEEMRNSFGTYTQVQAEIDYNSFLKNLGIDYIKELNYYDKKSVHNLKYFTWVEQQGKDVEELNAQWYDEHYWPDRFNSTDEWDKKIIDFNERVGLISKYK